MKHLFHFFLCITFFHNASSQNMSGKLTSDDLGSWAYLRYNSICDLVHSNIENGKLKTYFKAGKKLNKMEAMKEFEVQYIAFLSTDINDPTKGKDTAVNEPQRENFYSIQLNKTQISFKLTEKSEFIRFDYNEFSTLLNTDQLLFLKWYTTSGDIGLMDIPMVSKEILRLLNIKVFQYTVKDGQKVHKNDSLQSVFSKSELFERSHRQLKVFLSTDPDDPAIGKDTFYSRSIGEDLLEMGNPVFIYYTISGTMKSLHLAALSCGFNAYLNDISIQLPMPLGFVDINQNAGLLPDEMLLIERSIYQCISDRLISASDLERYKEFFKVKD